MPPLSGKVVGGTAMPRILILMVLLAAGCGGKGQPAAGSCCDRFGPKDHG